MQSLRQGRYGLFLFHNTDKIPLLRFAHIGQLHGNIKGQLFTVHHLLHFRDKGIDTDKAGKLCPAVAHFLRNDLVGALLGTGELFHLGAAASLAGHGLDLHFCGSGQLGSGNILSVQVAVHTFDLCAIIIGLDDNNGNGVVQLHRNIVTAMTGNQLQAAALTGTGLDRLIDTVFLDGIIQLSVIVGFTIDRERMI